MKKQQVDHILRTAGRRLVPLVIFEVTRAANSEEHASPDSSRRPPWEELRALGGRTRITANESVWQEGENGLPALVCLGGISSEALQVSGDFHEPLEDDDLIIP
jgi:hypothetical protein